MPLALVFIAAVLLIAAYNNTQGTLASNLSTDVGGFAKWFAAVTAVGALQWVPGMEKLSRWLLGLVLLVIVLKNYQAIFQGFGNIGSVSAQTAAVPDPAALYAANPSNPQITTASITGTGASPTGNPSSAGAPTQAGVAALFNPQSLVAHFDASLSPMISDPSSIGFGGV